ncbi:MAG: hypothetical protein ACTTKY_09780 [Catonella sp.]
MKNKFFVILLSTAVGISSIFSTEIMAAAKSYLYTSKKPVSKKTIYVGGDSVKLKYNINGRTKGIKGSWKSDNTGRIKVNKNGTCKAVGNGKATVSFTYKYGRKTYTLKCKFIAETKAGEVSILNSAGTTDEVTVESGTDYKFRSKITPVEEATELNNKIKSTDKVFYQLFADENCTQKTKLGTIDSIGVFSAGEKAGVLYVRASAKKTQKSEDDVVSDIIKINIEEAKKEEEPKKEEQKKEENKNDTKPDKLKPARIELSGYAVVRDITAQNSGYFADVSFKVFDGNGKEITASPILDNGKITATWKGSDAPINFAGKVTLFLPFSPPNIPNPIGTTGEVKLTYKGADNNEITAIQTVSVVPPSLITTAEFKGIYKCSYSTTNASIYYEAVLDKEITKLKNGDEIKDFGSYAMVNKMPDSYYLLIKATDNYGNNINAVGTRESKIMVDVTGSALVSLDTALENGVEIKESISPIAVDGVSYLTYPLKASKVKSGEINITIQGGTVRQVIKKMVTDGSKLSAFFLTGTIAYVGQDNIIPFVMYTSSGTAIKEYGEVLHYLGITDKDPMGVGTVTLFPDSKVLSSAKGSTFSIRRNTTTKEAEIHYMPNFNVLMKNNTIQDYGTDEITILKDYGTELEKKTQITVSKMRQ